MMRGIAALVVFCAAAAQAADGPANTWTAYGGGPGGGQYVALDQINRGNVGDLAVAWTYHTGDVSDGSDGNSPTTFEANPIIADGILYFCTPFNRVVALNAETGKEVWTADTGVDKAKAYFGIHVCRGVSHWQSDTLGKGACSARIFTATGDGRLIALDARTGERCADFGGNGEVDINDFDFHGDGRIGVTSPPAVVGNVVAVGNASASYGASDTPDGIVRAFDAVTGMPLWNWNPIPAHLSGKTGSANVWSVMSVDPARQLIFLPTTTPTPDPYGGDRTDDMPYANAVVALSAATGEPVWHFQTVHHDIFDYDLPAQPALVQVMVDGVARDAVVQITKTGFTFVLDRDTGAPLFPVEERAAPVSDVPGERTAPTQPWPVVHKPFTRQSLAANEAWGVTFWDRGVCRDKIAALRSEGLFTPPSFQGSVLIPNTSGGGNWGGAAIDPARQIMVVNATNIAFMSKMVPRAEFERGPAPDLGEHGHTGLMPDTPYVWVYAPILSPFGAPCTPPPWGTLTAIDLGSGDIRWQVPLGQVPVGPFKTPAAWGSPNVGGPMATAGGLVFIAAAMDGVFRAFDLETGTEAWRDDLPAPAMSTPMSYESGGRQFVVIAAGGHTPMGTKLGDAVVAYALPTRP